MEFDGFTVNLYRDEDGDWLAHFEELPNISAFSKTPEEALKELSVAWESVKESCRKHNHPIPQAPSSKQYTGTFNVRIDKRVHKALAIEAAKVGISLNALVSQKLATSVNRELPHSLEIAATE